MNEFICGDCEEELKRLPDECVDLVFTSPPYADQIKDYGEKVKRISTDKYVEWFIPKVKELYRVLKPTGSFVLNISDKLVGKYQDLFVFKLVVAICEDAGFHLIRDYIWYNPATPPNVFSRGNMGRTKKSHEYCFWFSKSDEWTFNMDPIRKPYSKDMQKFLQGKGKGDRADNTRPSRHNFKLDQKWQNHGGSDPGSVITLGNTSSNDAFHKLCKAAGISHPARFPQKLAEFFILSGSNEGDVVLDPFSGSGTTAVVSERLGRNWICIEINPQFCELAQEWITMIRNENNE
ncbi:site-specific DNA-methyltransferase [Oscillibacter valericigenes]|uniref:DNA-methyltransferase n=1 Tax=Oscillibacter valericigenes TaxID=351091 RepID=UPI001F3C496A|nr:site-specific DNA-methyltransferase [Oscillibacter valericigenes]MCF2663197.1 site-specific DNA-methyltransferase [Oscillibacter valericigenes]